MRLAALTLFTHVQTGLVRIIGSLLQLGLSLVLAHIGGTALLGRFLFFVAIVNLCVAIGGGMPNLMLRYASRNPVGRNPEVGWLWRHSLELSLLCAVVGGGFALAGNAFMRVAALAVGGLLVQRLSSAVLKSIGRPNLGVLLDAAFYPLVVLACALVMHAGSGGVTIEGLRLSYAASIWGAALIGVLLTWRNPNAVRSALSAPRRTARAMYVEIAAVTLGAAAQAVAANAPLTLAPLFLSDAEIGEFGLALRVAGFAATILISLAAYFGPAFTRADSGEELRQLRRRSQYACLILYLPVPAAVLAFPTDWLEQISQGLGAIKGLVLLLSVGFLVNAATGLAPTLLIMRGWSSNFSRIRVVAAALTVCALLVGGSVGGAVGMALGTSAAMTLENVWMFGSSSRRLRTMTTGPAVGSATS
jgi:O-antigen/teichoic acid export membrane protein